MINNYRYKFTICTTTFNRANLLQRLYNSLKMQDFSNFEWIIVNDGSTDNTENLVNSWIKESVLDIKYIKQVNSGKHVALNLAINRASGDLFLIVDSDDYLFNNTLSIFIKYWEAIKNNDNFSGVFANCVNTNNSIIGSKFIKDVRDSNFFDIFYCDKTVGDKCGFFRTDILKEFKFPVFGNEKFLPEALVWNRISLKYKTRFVNENLVVVDYQPDGLSKKNIEIRVANPIGTVIYYKEFLLLPIPVKWKVRNLINYIRFSLHGKISVKSQFINLKPTYLKFLFPVFLFIGLYFFYLDQHK